MMYPSNFIYQVENIEMGIRESTSTTDAPPLQVVGASPSSETQGADELLENISQAIKDTFSNASSIASIGVQLQVCSTTSHDFHLTTECALTMYLLEIEIQRNSWISSPCITPILENARCSAHKR